MAQIVQIPGISGLENNSILFEFREGGNEAAVDILDGSQFVPVEGFNICVLRSSDRHFGYKRTIHVWLRPGDYRNANLMIPLAYVLAGNPSGMAPKYPCSLPFPTTSCSRGSSGSMR